ncbi:hypothetical protein ACWEPC_02005 [Nonomuraea sp. NPDC004297]
MSQPTGTSRTPLVPAQRPPCQPWCIRHDYAEGICTGPTVATPGGRWATPGRLSVSHGPAGGTLFELHHDPDAELTADELEQLARMLLAQAALARPARA